MKRSRKVTLGFLTAAAASILGGCNAEPALHRQCVDAHGTVVADGNCSAGDWSGGSGTNSGGTTMPYRWYYGPSGWFPLGTRAYGGSYSAPDGARVVDASGTVRGVIGSHAGAAGGAHGAGE